MPVAVPVQADMSQAHISFKWTCDVAVPGSPEEKDAIVTQGNVNGVREDRYALMATFVPAVFRGVYTRSYLPFPLCSHSERQWQGWENREVLPWCFHGLRIQHELVARLRDGIAFSFELGQGRARLTHRATHIIG